MKGICYIYAFTSTCEVCPHQETCEYVKTKGIIDDA